MNNPEFNEMLDALEIESELLLVLDLKKEKKAKVNKMIEKKKQQSSQQRNKYPTGTSNPLPRKRSSRGRSEPISVPSSSSLPKIEEENGLQQG